MAEAARTEISEIATNHTLAANISNNSASIRVSPNSYFAVFFLSTFLIGFLVYLEKDLAAASVCLFSWMALPILAFNDRIVFDGQNIFRTGIIPALWAKLNRRPDKLKLSQIEQIETQALRALKRGGNIFYRYRTSVQGNELRFSFASGSEDYRRMVEKLFSSISVDTMDNRSIELRDYLIEPKEVLMKAEFARIPSMDVLESSINEFQTVDRNLRGKRLNEEIIGSEIEKASELRQLANELRLAGNLLQALEAFRRALLLNPSDSWLIFEFARCLHSYASVERNKKLAHKANAALRLAEQKAQKNGDLLARIGESYFQYGNWERAKSCFYKVLSVSEENFRAVRGLAEIALREGKIAHVIHHFVSAIHFAETHALKSWAQKEAKYFARLNDDEDYMDAEIKRINRLDNIERGKVMAMRFAIAGIVIVLCGILFDEMIASIGWTISSVSVLMWGILITGRNILLRRSPIVEDNN